MLLRRSQFTQLAPLSLDAASAPSGYVLVCKSDLSNDNWLQAGQSLHSQEGWESFLNQHHYSDHPQPLTAKDAAAKLNSKDILCLPLYGDKYRPHDVDKRNIQNGLVIISHEINGQINRTADAVTTQIDFRWIAVNEGGQVFRGYVPLGAEGTSGMTISTGFDIGNQLDESAGGDKDLSTLLKDFHSRFFMWLGIAMGRVSQTMVTEKIRAIGPVPTITAAEANRIDSVVMAAKRKEFLRLWANLRGELAAQGVRLLAFHELSPSWQTVLVDLFFNGYYIFLPKKFRIKGKTAADYPLIGILKNADAAAFKAKLSEMRDANPRHSPGFNERRGRRCDLIVNDSTGFIEPSRST